MGRRSDCEAYREVIESRVEKGAEQHRIRQDLSIEYGAEVSYDSVNRFVKIAGYGRHQARLADGGEPGQEAQIDYGTLYLPIGENGRPKKVVSLELNPKLQDFAAHYGTVILPSAAAHRQGRGRGRREVCRQRPQARAASPGSTAQHLRWWTANVADKRIHGTTKRQVGTRFEAEEKAALKPLPASCSIARAAVASSDSYIEVKGAYYEVPAQYIGQQVWARWDAAMVRVFDHKMEKLAGHTRLEKGRFSRVLGAGGTRGSVQQSVNYFRGKVIPMGEQTTAWADEMIASDKDRALRRLQGLLSLRGKYTAARIEEAARKARIHGQHTLRDLRRWLESPNGQETFSFLQQHELIRQTDTYDSLAQTGDLFN